MRAEYDFSKSKGVRGKYSKLLLKNEKEARAHLRRITKAALKVGEKWERGDLAGAVRELVDRAKDADAYLYWTAPGGQPND